MSACCSRQGFASRTAGTAAGESPPTAGEQPTDNRWSTDDQLTIAGSCLRVVCDKISGGFFLASTLGHGRASLEVT